MKSLIKKLSCSRATQIYRSEDGSINIEFYEIAKEDLKRNWNLLILPLFFCLFMLAGLFAFIQLLTYAESSVERLGALFVLIPSLLPIFVIYAFIAPLLRERKIELRENEFIYKQRVLKNEWKEICRFPRNRLVITESEEKELIYQPKFNSFKILYSDGHMKAKELFGDKLPTEMNLVASVLSGYCKNEQLHNIDISTPTYETVSPIEKTLGKKETLFNTRFSRIDIAALILMMWGLAETILFILAITSQRGFSGMAFIWCFLGYRLYKRNIPEYKRIMKGMHFFLPMVFAGFTGIIISFVQFLTSTGSIPIHSEVSQNIHLILSLYIILIPTICFLLMHPATRKELKLPIVSENPLSLFLSKKSTLIILAGTVAFTLLLHGPHLFNNPYTKIREGVPDNSDITSQVGSAKKIIVKGYSIHNWTLYSDCEVWGDIDTSLFLISISHDGEFTVASEDTEQDSDIIERDTVRKKTANSPLTTGRKSL